MENLKQILSDSQRYWETNGAEGKIANLTNFDLRKCNLEDANFTGANLSKANFTDACLANANFTNANLANANFTNANLANANFTNVDFTNANLTNTNFTNADLTEAILAYTNLINTNFTNADLTRANLYNANFLNANLSGINLSEASLLNTILTGVSLSSAILKDAIVGDGSVPIDPSVFGRAIDPELELRVANQILVPTALNMCEWHSCNTTHCLAGWAIHLSGEEGYRLEQETSPSVAGAMLLPSATHLFYATEEQAIDWADAVIYQNEKLTTHAYRNRIA